MKYRVTLEQRVIERAEIEVEAEDADEAERLAREKANESDDVEWFYYNTPDGAEIELVHIAAEQEGYIAKRRVECEPSKHDDLFNAMTAIVRSHNKLIMGSEERERDMQLVDRWIDDNLDVDGKL